jgi:hypothetical protein
MKKNNLESFGDIMCKKQPNTFRILLQNINNLPTLSLVNPSQDK